MCFSFHKYFSFLLLTKPNKSATMKELEGVGTFPLKVCSFSSKDKSRYGGEFSKLKIPYKRKNVKQVA